MHWKENEKNFYQIKGSMNIAGCGDLFRDSDEQWLRGYMQRIKACDTLHAKIWRMYTWMQMARRQGYKNLIVESNNKLLIDMVTRSCKFNGNTPILVRPIQYLSKLQWHFVSKHTRHEGNVYADWLPSFSLYKSSNDIRILRIPPEELQNLFFMTYPGLSCLGVLV